MATPCGRRRVGGMAYMSGSVLVPFVTVAYSNFAVPRACDGESSRIESSSKSVGIQETKRQI